MIQPEEFTHEQLVAKFKWLPECMKRDSGETRHAFIWDQTPESFPLYAAYCFTHGMGDYALAGPA